MRCLAKVGQICGCGRVKLPGVRRIFRLIGTKHRTFSMHLCVEHVRPTSQVSAVPLLLFFAYLSVNLQIRNPSCFSL